jgi:hypothetical protein
MPLPPAFRKFWLATHLALSVGWIGAVLVYLALSVTAMTTRDPETVRAGWIAMELTGWYVIVPLALASILTGLVMALGTKWGLFRHYWVLFSLVLTTFATVILLLHMPDVSLLAEVARDPEGAALDPAREHLLSRLPEGDLLHPGLGLVVLLLVQILNVYKPRGVTPYGRRKENERGERSPRRDTVTGS